jgi:hypothetical protein
MTLHSNKFPLVGLQLLCIVIFIHNSRFDTFFCIIEKLKRIYYNAKRMAKTIVEIEEQKAVKEEAA